jgi:hypothetical protein
MEYFKKNYQHAENYIHVNWFHFLMVDSRKSSSRMNLLLIHMNIVPFVRKQNNTFWDSTILRKVPCIR